MTTWHEGDTLEEALWFFTINAVPDDAFTLSCTTWLAVAIGAGMPIDTIRHYLGHPHLLDIAVGL
jgi:hypothetical protein